MVVRKRVRNVLAGGTGKFIIPTEHHRAEEIEVWDDVDCTFVN